MNYWVGAAAGHGAGGVRAAGFGARITRDAMEDGASHDPHFLLAAGGLRGLLQNGCATTRRPLLRPRRSAAGCPCCPSLQGGCWTLVSTHAPVNEQGHSYRCHAPPQALQRDTLWSSACLI